MTSTAILIPARYGSTRYPGKPLLDLNGQTMIQRVFERCCATGIDTYVLTDSAHIAQLIPPDHCYVDHSIYNNGTERCSGAIQNSRFINYDRFINVQGDMPDVTTQLINQALLSLEMSYDVGTVYTQLPESQKHNPHVVKMVRSEDRAIWFARGIVGYGEWHLGVYSYTREALNEYINLPVPIEESIENLEQLRWIKNGWTIGCRAVEFAGVEINTPEDFVVWKQTNLRKSFG